MEGTLLTDLALLSYLDDDEFETMLFMTNLSSEFMRENQLVEEMSHSEKERLENKKKKKTKAISANPIEGVVTHKKGMSVLDVIEQMNSKNMTGRKAKNLQKDGEPHRKGKKGKK